MLLTQQVVIPQITHLQMLAELVIIECFLGGLSFHVYTPRQTCMTSTTELWDESEECPMVAGTSSEDTDPNQCSAEGIYADEEKFDLVSVRSIEMYIKEHTYMDYLPICHYSIQSTIIHNRSLLMLITNVELERINRIVHASWFYLVYYTMNHIIANTTSLSRQLLISLTNSCMGTRDKRSWYKSQELSLIHISFLCQHMINITLADQSLFHGYKNLLHLWISLHAEDIILFYSSGLLPDSLANLLNQRWNQQLVYDGQKNLCDHVPARLNLLSGLNYRAFIKPQTLGRRTVILIYLWLATQAPH